MARADENRAAWLKDAAKEAASRLNRKRLEGKKRSIVISKIKRPAIEVRDVQAIPDEFKETVTTVKVDKNAILARLEDTGELVPGVEARPVTAVRFN